MQKSVAAELASGGRQLVRIDREDINVVDGGRRAVVNAGVRRRIVGADGRGVMTEGVETFALEKRRGRWMIVSVQRQP